MQNELAARLQTALNALDRDVVDAHTARQAIREALKMVQPVEEKPAPVAVVEPVKATAPRCCFYATIRSFYARAIDCGMDVKDVAAMRRAMSRLLGFEVVSRKQLTASHWAICKDSLERGWGW